MLDFFKEGWLGNLFGVSGIIIAIYLYFRPLRVPKPRVAIKAQHVLSWKGGELPSEIAIMFRGDPVPRLGRSIVRFWNGGSGDLDFSSMRSSEPLKIELAGDGKILDIAVLTVTRAGTKCTVRFDREEPTVAYIEFDFLAPGDGMVIGLLHTDGSPVPVIKGEFRDSRLRLVEGSVSDFSLDSIMNRSKLFKPKMVAVALLIVGGIFLCGAMLQQDIFNDVSARLGFPIFENPVKAWPARVAMGVVGMSYSGLALMFFWSKRRKYPKALAWPPANSESK